jgi:hypothetical protein
MVSPEDAGIHRARVSDRATLELMVDELRAVAEGNRDEGVVRKHAVPVYSLKGEPGWKLTGGSFSPPSVHARAAIPMSAGVSVGRTFIPADLSREHGIERLTKATTRTMLNRELMSTTGKTASYYSIRYLKQAPFVEASYVQFVTDREWDRVLYGNLNYWIKAYGGLRGPTCIATDAEGRVFIGEAGNQRVSVLRLNGTGQEAVLSPLFVIPDAGEPSDIAHSDAGTPLVTGDDILYVADPVRNAVLRYALGSSNAALTAVFEEFDAPNAVLAGVWNGANSALLYVVDKVGRRIRLFSDDGGALTQLREITGPRTQYIQSMEADHFGNVYAVDNVGSRVSKYTADLILLDSEGGADMFESPGSLSIPFGRIEVEGEGTYWTGFDQAFTLERWSNNSGVQRMGLGVAMKDIRFGADDGSGLIANSFLLTDVADVTIRIYDEAGKNIRTLYSGWAISGPKTFDWDRRDQDGRQVNPGRYTFEIQAASAYRDESTVSVTALDLPMFVWQDCGNAGGSDDGFLVRGNPVSWGAEPERSINEHESAVEYLMTGLNPESEYEVCAEYVASDGIARMQDLAGDGIPLHDAVMVNRTPGVTGFLRIPRQAFADGEVRIAVRRQGEGTAVVSQLWFRETGTSFAIQTLNANRPEEFTLAQNFPNPFNPSTVIRFTVAQPGPVSLKVYDVAGREVATLVDGFHQPGSYDAVFDIGTASSGRGLASGVYFYRVTAGKYTATKKMVLVK